MTSQNGPEFSVIYSFLMEKAEINEKFFELIDFLNLQIQDFNN